MRGFLSDWREHGLGTALYNALFLILHRHDDHVRVWQDGERCPGCEAVPGSMLSTEFRVELEALAALEHEQWAHWTQYMLDNLTPENVARWRRQIETSYADLSEREKESDRAWARKVLDVQRSVWSVG